MLKSFTPNDKIVMVKNPNYREAASRQDRPGERHPRSRTARPALRRFQAGELHTYTTSRPTRSSSSGDPEGPVQGRAVSGHLLFRVQHQEAALRRRPRASGALHGDRPRLPGGRHLGRDDDPGLFLRAAGHRQLWRAGHGELEGPVADRAGGQGQGAAEGGRLRPRRQEADGRNPLQHLREPQEHVGRACQHVEAAATST